MQYLYFFCLALSLVSCSALLEHKDEIEDIVEDVIDEEVESRDF